MSPRVFVDNEGVYCLAGFSKEAKSYRKNIYAQFGLKTPIYKKGMKLTVDYSGVDFNS